MPPELEAIQVDYYGAPVSLCKIASCAPHGDEPGTYRLKLFDPSSVQDVEAAIRGVSDGPVSLVETDGLTMIVRIAE